MIISRVRSCVAKTQHLRQRLTGAVVPVVDEGGQGMKPVVLLRSGLRDIVLTMRDDETGVNVAE